MADESREYTIRIVGEGVSDESAGASSAIAGSSTPSSTASARSSRGGGLLSKENAQAYMKGLVAYHTVKSFATQIINNEVSLVELRTGSKQAQEKANFYNNVIQKSLGILETTVTGALVGGLPGALVGLALGTTHTLVSYAQAQQNIDLQRTLENRSLEMQNIRAGASGSRRSVQ